MNVRHDFPILGQKVHGKPLVYLDSAATSQKPRSVIEAVTRYYSQENANIHRGIHVLSERATEEYEKSRQKVQHFLKAKESREIIFVRGATEGINLVAHSFLRSRLKSGDEILVSAMEHHANIVPWQMVADEKGGRLRVIPITDQGELILEEYKKLLSDRTRFVAITQVSNVLGTINPVKEMIQAAHARGIPVLVDGAQAVPHLNIDVQSLDCDFYVFSGHKVYAPTGIGIVYGKTSHLESMTPYQGGGDMIKTVSFEKTTYNEIPYKFEAGTPHIEGAIGLGVALDYLQGLGITNVAAYENELLTYATESFSTVKGLRIIGTAPHKASVISFVLDDVHPHDIGTFLDQEGIAIRTGHHCAMPLMHRFGLPATARISLALYNTREEVDLVCKHLKKIREVFCNV